MTEEAMIQIQIENAKKAKEHHAQFAASYAGLAQSATGPDRDTYAGQADFHQRQAKKWETRLKQLGVSV